MAKKIFKAPPFVRRPFIIVSQLQGKEVDRSTTGFISEEFAVTHLKDMYDQMQPNAELKYDSNEVLEYKRYMLIQDDVDRNRKCYYWIEKLF